MKLNRVEKALMNNSVRALVQRSYEAPLLEQLVLEVRPKSPPTAILATTDGAGTSSVLSLAGQNRVFGRTSRATRRPRRRAAQFHRVLEVGCGRGVGTQLLGLDKAEFDHIHDWAHWPERPTGWRRLIPAWLMERDRTAARLLAGR